MWISEQSCLQLVCCFFYKLYDHNFRERFKKVKIRVIVIGVSKCITINIKVWLNKVNFIRLAITVKVVNIELGFISFSFLFIFLIFIEFYFYFYYFGLKQRSMM